MSALTPEPPEKMRDFALSCLSRYGADHMLAHAAAWVRHWSDLADEVASGAHLDGRASIYTGETYAEARDRWTTYYFLLEEALS